MADIKSAQDLWLAEHFNPVYSVWVNDKSAALPNEERNAIALDNAKAATRHAEYRLSAIATERDMLAKRCADQAHEIAKLILSRPTFNAEAVADAVFARASADGALHRDAMIEVLRCLGAR